MDINKDKIGDAALAFLFLTLHERSRAWKQIDWGVLNRLHKKGLIFDPINKTKSVVLSDDGLEKSELLFRKLFGK